MRYFILIAVLFFPAFSFAKVTYTESREYYEIEGSTSMELYRQMQAKGENMGNNRFHVALTKTDVNYSVTRSYLPGVCKPIAHEVKLKIVIQMPKWKNMPKSGVVRERWKKFYKSTLVHEYAHKNYSIEYANAFDEKLAGLGTYANCADLDNAIEVIHKNLWAEMEKKNNRLDEEDYKKADLLLSEFLAVR